jgi:hypothetical protein
MGGVVSISKRSLSFLGGERVGGGVRGSIGGDELDAIAAVGDEGGVEAVGLLSEVVFEKTPALFAVAAAGKGRI